MASVLDWEGQVDVVRRGRLQSDDLRRGLLLWRLIVHQLQVELTVDADIELVGALVAALLCRLDGTRRHVQFHEIEGERFVLVNRRRLLFIVVLAKRSRGRRLGRCRARFILVQMKLAPEVPLNQKTDKTWRKL